MSYQKNYGAVRRFSFLLKISVWLQNIPNKVTPAPFRLLQYGSAFWQSRILYVATNLDIATHLADNMLTIKQLSKLTSSNLDATYRMMRMLCSMGIFEESSYQVFRNNRVSNYLRQDKPNNLRAMILMHNSKEMSLPWYESLEQGIKSGNVPFELSHQQDMFSYMANNPQFSLLFSEAMDSVETLIGDSFASDFNWNQFDRIIDFGGSKGSKSISIAKHHNNPKILVIDHEHVIKGANHFWKATQQQSILSRISFRVGDVFEPIELSINDGDIFLLSAVLHLFDDNSCVSILKNISKSIVKTQARIAILELVLTESNPDFAMTTFDLQMFMATRGKERTIKEWKNLFLRSGVKLEEIVKLRSYGKILVVKTAN